MRTPDDIQQRIATLDEIAALFERGAKACVQMSKRYYPEVWEKREQEHRAARAEVLQRIGELKWMLGDDEINS